MIQDRKISKKSNYEKFLKAYLTRTKKEIPGIILGKINTESEMSL